MVFIFILLATFSLLLFYLTKQFRREQKSFEQRIENLQKTIAELNHKATLQNSKIQLTEELEKILLVSKPKLGTMIFDLYYDLFESLSQNNMIKP